MSSIATQFGVLRLKYDIFVVDKFQILTKNYKELTIVFYLEKFVLRNQKLADAAPMLQQIVYL